MYKIVFLTLIISFLLVGCADTESNLPPADDDTEVIVMEEDEEITGDDSDDDADTTPKELPEEENSMGINKAELSIHNAPEDCWIVYEGKVYDYSDAPRHPSMDKTIYAHCGKTTGFEEGAKARHGRSSAERVSNYGPYIGDLI